MISIARILGAPVMRAAGERGRQEVEGVPAGREPAGHGGHEVLDGGGALEAQEPRHADGPRHADPPEVVAQHVHDHHVLGLVLAAGEELAGQRAVLARASGRAAACP